MANHALPTISSPYVEFLSQLQSRIDDAVRDSNSETVSLSNPPTGLVRWNNTNNYWEINTGTPASPNWAVRSTRYDININGTVGEQSPTTGKFTAINVSGIAALGEGSTVNSQAITTASNTQTLTNKTLTSPAIATISNSGTITIPTGTDTLVGRSTTDTLTNKTLNNPKVSTGSSIQDVNGITLIKFPTAVTSAANYIEVTNAVSGSAPTISVEGTGTNISLNLKSKGSGTVTINGVTAVTTTGTQTLTNKTLTAPVISTISNSGTVTIPTGTDTLVNLTGTQTLTNKIINSSEFNGTIGATTASTGKFTSIEASGNITAEGTVTSYSDARLKTDLAKVDNALDKVKRLSGYYYTRLDTGTRNVGLIAQEVSSVIPEAVIEGEYLSVAYGNLVGLLVEAIKELDVKLDKIYAKII